MKESEEQYNVFGETLVPCSLAPVTGYTRNGCCDSHPQDHGLHTVCAIMTDEFLEFSASRGNDLSTPRPEYDFPGLVAGDQWCLCVGRWVEALEAGCAPRIFLAATNQNVLDYVGLDLLIEFSK